MKIPAKQRDAFIARLLEIVQQCEERCNESENAEFEEPQLDAYGAIVAAARHFGLLR